MQVAQALAPGQGADVRLARDRRRPLLVRHAGRHAAVRGGQQDRRRRCAHGRRAGPAQVRRGLYVCDVQAARRPVCRAGRQALPGLHGPLAAGGDCLGRGAVFALHAQARLRRGAANPPARQMAGPAQPAGHRDAGVGLHRGRDRHDQHLGRPASSSTGSTTSSARCWRPTRGKNRPRSWPRCSRRRRWRPRWRPR
jgi:hypothetical protein